MRFDYWFSKRLKLSKGRADSTSTGIVIAVAGVALALMIMELSLAIVSGFKHEIQRKLIGFDAAITVLPPYDYNLSTSASEMTVDSTLFNIISTVIPDAKAIETYQRHAILKTDSDFIAIQCLAYGADHDYSFEQSNLKRGHGLFDTNSSYDDIVISEQMARTLSLDTADRVFLYFFVDGKPKTRRANISGIYNSNFGDYDKSVIYTSLPLLQQLDNTLAPSITAIAIEKSGIPDIQTIIDESKTLQQELIDQYRLDNLTNIYPVTNIVERGCLYFSWLDLLDTNVIVIFILMVCVAGFTLISSLFIIILDHISTIGILRALGASKKVVNHIFINIALKIVGIGMAIGNILTWIIIGLQKATHFLPLNPDMYYLDSVPFMISPLAVIALNAGVIVGAWIILILPARLASRIDPAATMRYE